MNEDEIVLKIAREWLQMEGLTVQNSDRLDFYQLHVSDVKRALKEAYNLGFRKGYRDGYNDGLSDEF